MAKPTPWNVHLNLVPQSPAAADAPGLYRPDIDGLRGIAVLAVVGFHAEIAAFRGGFSGVDVFFVISGYLISGIVFRELQKGTFTFAQFYTRRINRIFPALGVTLVVTALIGWLVLFPPEFEALGKHVVGGATFVSNFLLWSETGYFDSKNKPLLHLWSLAVEEQFYLIWPAFLLFAWRRRWNMTMAIGAIAGASLAMNLWTVAFADRTAAFYFPFTRLWELLGGALLSWRDVNRPARGLSTRTNLTSEAASVLGLALVAAGIVAVSAEMPWPGSLALLPVGGTILMIGPGAVSRVNRDLLGNRLLVWVGLISYPLYLWHWPLLVYGRLINEGQLTRTGRIGIVVLSFVLAAATYEFVEKPIRFGRRKRRSAGILVPLIAGIGLLGFAFQIGAAGPRLSGAFEDIVTLKDENPPGSSFSRSGDIVTPVIRGDTSRTVALIGDSHATMYWPRLQKLSGMQGDTSRHFVLFGYGGCIPMPGLNHIGQSWDGLPYRCDRYHAKALEHIRRPSVDRVVYAAYWENYFREQKLFFSADPSRQKIPTHGPALDSAFRLLEVEVRSLRAAGKQIYLVLPNPDSPANHPDSMMPRRLPGLTPRRVRLTTERSEMDERTAFVREHLMEIAVNTGATIIDPMPHLCTATRCRTKTTDGKAIYGDPHHLRPAYARDSATFIDVVAR